MIIKESSNWSEYESLQIFRSACAALRKYETRHGYQMQEPSSALSTLSQDQLVLANARGTIRVYKLTRLANNKISLKAIEADAANHNQSSVKLEINKFERRLGIM